MEEPTIEDQSSYNFRKHTRFNRDCGIRYRILERDEICTDVETVNISGGGARIKSDHDVPLGSILALEIVLPGPAAPVMALGKIVWRKKNGDGTFEQGVEFWGMGYCDKQEHSMASSEATRTE